MGQFDETARQTAKEAPAAFLAWLLRHELQSTPWTFLRWDDARRTPLPGGPERTDDLVAVLQQGEEPSTSLAYQIIEIESEPDPRIWPRLGVYGWLLVAEKMTAGAEPPQVGVALLQLTGEVSREGQRVAVAQTSMELSVQPLVVNLQEDEAAATLAAIAAGRFGTCILPLVPLMRGGEEPSLIEEWKRVAENEPDVARRGPFRDRAVVFAELAGCLVNWQTALRGWQMRESQVIKGWMNEGELVGIVKARRADLLEVIQARFQDPVPESVRVAIEGTNDPTTLQRWFDLALQVSTLAELRAAMPLEN